MFENQSLIQNGSPSNVNEQCKSVQSNVLLVENDPVELEMDCMLLKQHNYAIFKAESLKQAHQVLQENWCDLIIMDCHYPDGSGLDFCRDIKKRNNMLVMFLSMKDKNEDIVCGYKAGGDGYMVKPYCNEVLLAYIQCLLRRMYQKSVMCQNRIFMDLISLQAFIDGVDIKLTQKEFSLLLLLLQNKGKVLGQEMIYRAVWGQPINNDYQTLYSTIYRLKKKLERRLLY